MGHMDRFSLTVACLIIMFAMAGLFNALAPGGHTLVYIAMGALVAVGVAAVSVVTAKRN